MKIRLFYLLVLIIFALSACNRSADDYQQVLSKCSILGDETKKYARANYIRLFYTINPEKFEATYQKIANFDQHSHRAMINTYIKALQRLNVEDQRAKHLIKVTLNMAVFVNNFVDNDYKKAVNHQYQSLHNPKSDQFFVEINEIVKFDYNVKGFDSHKETFKALLEDYQEALKVYAKQSI